MSIRPVKRARHAQPTFDGASVHLLRAFGFGDPTEPDPFLPLDDFRNDDPERCQRLLSAGAVELLKAGRTGPA